MSFRSGGYTITLGGGALLAGAMTSGTVTVPGATAGMHVKITPQADPGVGAWWYGFVSSANTVTVRVGAVVALTPASVVYSVEVEG